MDEQQILDHLKRAFELEESGDIRSAIPFFQEAADGLDSIAEDEEDSQRRRKLRERARGYGSHARGLEKKLKDAETAAYQRFDQGEKVFAEALDEDAGKHVGIARKKYLHAAETYINVVKDVESPLLEHLKDLQRKAKERAGMVLDRAEELKRIEEGHPPRGAGGSGTGGGGSGGGGGGGGKPGAGGFGSGGFDFPEPPSTKPSTPHISSPSETPMPSGPPTNSRQPSVSGQFSKPRGHRRGAQLGEERLTKGEIAVLKRTSYVNGRCFLPWLDTDVLESFVSHVPFEDKEGGILPLSPKQTRHLAGWRRPSEFMDSPVMIEAITPLSITQELVTDCSFVASLCVAATYEQRFRRQLVTRIIYPQNERGIPVYNPSGKYMVRLRINGVDRKVVVDDRLPVSESGRPLCSYSKNPREMWVSIIEKAYMKVAGGYDFPGSNAGVDLHVLTGWIPEGYRVGGPNWDQERTWQRLLSGSTYGDCLLTIATGSMTEEEEERTGLVESHAYAVLEVKEACGVRMVKIKNPWAHRRWKGRYSVMDTTSWTAELQQLLKYDISKAAKEDNGVFWMDYDAMLKFFRNVYFNWNPELFEFRKIIHGTWPQSAPGPLMDRYNIGYNPQYRLSVNVPQGTGDSAMEVRAGKAFTVNKQASVWILLTRHITFTETDTQRRNREGRMITPDEDDKDFMTLHVYHMPQVKSSEDGGPAQPKKGEPEQLPSYSVPTERIYFPGDPLVNGVYSNNQHVLSRLDFPPGQHDLILVISQLKRSFTLDYSLDVYSMAPVLLRPVMTHFPHENSIAGKWTEASAGGNTNSPAYCNNPQFLMKVVAQQDVQIRVEAPKDFAVGIRVYPIAERLTSYRESLISSGTYCPAVSTVSYRNLFPGQYNIVLSTYSPGQVGPFRLFVASSVKPLPSLSPL